MIVLENEFDSDFLGFDETKFSPCIKKLIKPQLLALGLINISPEMRYKQKVQKMQEKIE